jgi:hypothetical protein
MPVKGVGDGFLALWGCLPSESSPLAPALHEAEREGLAALGSQSARLATTGSQMSQGLAAGGFGALTSSIGRPSISQPFTGIHFA